MKKKLLSIGAILVGAILFSTFFRDSKIEEARKKHMDFFNNHPYQKTTKLSKKERKALGLPPNAYFEQKYLSEINPYTGRTHKESLYKLQERLNNSRLAQKVPGASDNVWIERGPNNVGGRTRAVIFDPNDTTNETVFAGGVSGGLWKNTKISDANSSWVRVGIPENLAVSCIAVDPNNSKIFYVGTGESYVNGNITGNGLWKSIDGGNSWKKVFGGVTGELFLDTNSKVTVNMPSSIQGDYVTVLTNAFGSEIASPITGDLVLANDGTDPASDACEDIQNATELNGKIAVVTRGACNFSLKAKKAQDAGAVAVIVVNNVDTNPFNMAAGDNSDGVTIPSLMISKENGDAIITALSSGAVNATLSMTNKNATNATVVPGVQHINDIVVRNNSGVSEVYVAAGEAAYTGGVSLGGESLGLYKSVDGTNFSKLNVPKTSGGNDYEPNNLDLGADNSIYLATTRSSVYGDGGGTVFKSTDGVNFVKKYTVPSGIRTEIAASRTAPGIVYILAQAGDKPVKIIKTTDDFTTTTDLALPNDADDGISADDFTRGQAFYDLLIKVDPKDENTLYVGGIDLFKSTDGGTSWTQISHWYGGFGYQYVHADQHGLAFASSNRMVFSNDGGVYFSDNGGTTIGSRNKDYNTLQFYTVGVAPTTAFNGQDYFLAGAQDNGTQLFEGAKEEPVNSEEASGGDGAASFFDTDGTDKYYITNYVYNGNIILYNYATNLPKKINEEDASNGDFINQEELDSNLNILYSNYSSGTNYIVKRYSNLLGNVVKTDLTNDLMDVSPSALKISPYNKTSSNLYLGLKNGKLLKVENADKNSQTWSDITGKEFIGSISDVEFGKTENEIFVTMHNYGVVSVWFTKDGGATWQNKEGDFPDIPVKTILQNPLSTNEVIIGTNLGVWKTENFDTDSPNWTRSQNGMSNVPVLDLDLRDDNTVFAATYGRGVFSGAFKLDPNGDADRDGVLNKDDNCPNTANADQADSDDNGIGDVCQDTDKDGVIDIEDNCPTTANPDQADADNNGVGDACQDTDEDGIMDNVDNCITTPNPDQKDGNNNGIGDVCDTSYEEANNISIQTVSETCVDQNDGKIIVNVVQTYVDYKVTIKGESKTLTEQLTGALRIFSDLAPGSYEVCLEVNGRDYKQCFEVNIKEAVPVALKVEKNQQSKDYTVNVNSGTAPFNVFLNGKLVSTFNSSRFNVKLENGGILEVKTAKSCEGAFKTAIDNVFLKQNPVVDSIDFMLPADSSLKVDVMVFDVTGKLVLDKAIQRQGDGLSIPFSGYKSGVYIVKLGVKNSKTIKIIKQ